MDFIMTTLKLYAYGFTTTMGGSVGKHLPIGLVGIVPALVLILLWMLLKRAFGTRELVMLEGTIESHAEMQTNRHGKLMYFAKATFSLDDKTRVFFKYLDFTKNLWNNINANSVIGMYGKFFGWKEKNSFTVFAFSNSNGTAAFLDDFDKPHSLARKVFNICLRASIILIFPLIAYPDLTKETDLKFYKAVYGAARGSDEAAYAAYKVATTYAHASPLAIFCLFIAGYSLFLYFKQIRSQPETLRKQLEMLDRVGVKRPLG